MRGIRMCWGKARTALAVLVYDLTLSWQPDFDEAGNLAGSAEEWFDSQRFGHYPFE